MSERDWPLVVRRATPGDRETVLGFASTTWDGWDYIPNAWDSWLAADDGVLLVACPARTGAGAPLDADRQPLEVGRAVAVARVALLSPSEAWLEGIRVDPRVRGLGVATDFQAAELRWAAASGARVVRYATSQRNEASHRLGARHGLSLLARLRSWAWHERPPTDEHADDDDSESGFEPAARAAAARARRALLAELDGAGLVARPQDGDAWWRRVDHDPSLQAMARLCEHRGWTVQELTRTLFDGYLERGEVLVSGAPDDDAWALAMLNADVLAAEDVDLHLATLCGDGAAALRLVRDIQRRADQRLRFRLAHDAPLAEGREDALAAAGFHPRPWELHILARELDDAHPVPDPARPELLVMADEPAPLRPTIG